MARFNKYSLSSPEESLVLVQYQLLWQIISSSFELLNIFTFGMCSSWLPAHASLVPCSGAFEISSLTYEGSISAMAKRKKKKKRSRNKNALVSGWTTQLSFSLLINKLQAKIKAKLGFLFSICQIYPHPDDNFHVTRLWGCNLQNRLQECIGKTGLSLPCPLQNTIVCSFPLSTSPLCTPGEPPTGSC